MINSYFIINVLYVSISFDCVPFYLFLLLVVFVATVRSGMAMGVIVVIFIVTFCCCDAHVDDDAVA